MDLMSFSDWVEIKEGGAHRRAKRDAFRRKTIPPLAPADVHGGGTGYPWEVETAEKVPTHVDVKKKKKRRKKKREEVLRSC